MYNFLVKDTTIENADMIIVPLFEDNLNFKPSLRPNKIGSKNDR